MYRKRRQNINLSKLNDMMNLIYMMNRIKENDYDQNINNMSPIDQTKNIIMNLSDNIKDSRINQNAEIFVELLRNVDRLNRNNRGILDSQYSIKNNYNVDFLGKIKYFLKSLNGEE